MDLSARDILDRLVAFPTVSRDSNLDLVDWVEGYLATHGVKAHRTWNADRTKAALFANVGPEVEGGVVLSGHTDVVPVDGQKWSTDPFVVTEKDGKLFGRGTTDMKGFDAIALAAVPKALNAGIKRPLQIALSYDEELGCTGAPPMIDDMVGILPKAAACLVGEPSMMKVVTGHKGSSGYEIHFHGFEVHSSLPHQGVSAIMEAARLIDWANAANEVNRAETPSDVAAIFDPPWTSLHVGTIEGGTAHNITAKDCRFYMDFRIVAGDTVGRWETAMLDKVRDIEVEMQTVRPEAKVTVNKTFEIPGLVPESKGAAEELARAITGDNGTHVVSYGTEAGQFQERGYSAVVCGPGDIAMAHQPDEFITCAQFDAGVAFVDKLINRLAA